MPTDKVLPHDPLRRLAKNVWMVRGSNSFPLRRNMIVIRQDSDQLIIHSAVAMDVPGLNALTALGTPTMAIVPSRGHQKDAPFYQAHFPDLKVVCPAGARSAVEPNVRLSGTVEDIIPTFGWVLHKVPGIKIDEFVYELPLEGGGKMLMANDVFGGPNSFQDSLLGRLFVPLGVPGNQFGIARIFRWQMISDLAGVRHFAAELSDVPDVRLVTGSHGDPLTHSPAVRLRAIAGL
jgi:hypothetical protein